MTEKYSTATDLSKVFPNIKKNKKSLEITSPIDQFYNCVAWALGDDQKWWEPSPVNFPLTYWPVAREGYAIDKYELMLASQGYVKCNDGTHVDGKWKVVLYVGPGDLFTHIARQTLDPKPGWSSKCGKASDVWHATPETLEGPTYGRVWGYFER